MCSSDLVEGSPAEALDHLRGKIWSKVVSSDAELSAIDSAFNVVSTHLVGGLHEVRVYSDSSPGDGFTQDDANLEDVYFLTLSKQTGTQAPASQAKN